MTSKPVALLLADLGVTKSHSRPYVSDDNPFSEAQFKTLKYRPAFPDRFGSLVDARGFCQAFFPWYNSEHHHSGIGLLTPEDVHLGRAVSASRRAPTCWPAPTPRIPSASSAGCPSPPPCRARCGSTRRNRRPRPARRNPTSQEAPGATRGPRARVRVPPITAIQTQRRQGVVLWRRRGYLMSFKR